MRIVLVEDNQSLRRGITYRLADDGHAVDALEDGDMAGTFLSQEDFDLVILDINLPGRNGLEILGEMRGRGDPRPVILLTARSSTEDRVIGLDTGADDYLVKPFAMDELAARVRALSRRKDVAPRRTIPLGPVTLDLEAPLLHDLKSFKVTSSFRTYKFFRDRVGAPVPCRVGAQVPFFRDRVGITVSNPLWTQIACQITIESSTHPGCCTHLSLLRANRHR
ncbi:MAG: response regulator, partial [Pseudomonadota bacterium]